MGADILLVDDDPKLLEIVSVSLGRQGYRVRTAATGREALEHASGSPPHLLILDLDLPDMSGIDVIRRARVQRPQIRTVLMSGYPSTHPAVAGMLSEVSAYFSKPVDVDLLLEVVVPGGSSLDS